MEYLAHKTSISRILPTALFHGQARSESPNSPSPSTLWFVKVVSTLCIRHTQSLSVLNSDYMRMNLDPSVAFDVIYHISNRFDNPDLACSFFCYSRHNLNLIHSESTFDLLLRSLCRVNLLDSAKLVFDYMIGDRIAPNSSLLDFMISSFANAGKYKIAEGILISKAELCYQRKEIVNPFVYNKFLSLLISRNQIDDAVAFFKGHVLKSNSFRPDNYTFNIVMRGLCLSGKVERARMLFDMMRNFGCRPDLFTYNTLINGFCRAGKLDRAQELLREIQVQCEFSPDVVTYTSLISGYCKSGKVEDAAILFEEMVGHGIRPNLFTFNTIIDGFAKKGEVASAWMMYERLVGSGFHPDAVTFTSLIDGHSRVGDMDQCMKLWDEMHKRGLSSNAFTYSVLINGLCKVNRLDEARDMLRQLSRRADIVPQPFIYNPVIDLFCKAGNLDEANAIVAEMEAKGCIHDKMTFTILIVGHCMKGRMGEAIGIYNKMLSVGCAPDVITVRSLVIRLRKAGMAHEANAIEQNELNSAHTCAPSSERPTELKTSVSITCAV